MIDLIALPTVMVNSWDDSRKMSSVLDVPIDSYLVLDDLGNQNIMFTVFKTFKFPIVQVRL